MEFGRSMIPARSRRRRLSRAAPSTFRTIADTVEPPAPDRHTTFDDATEDYRVSLRQAPSDERMLVRVASGISPHLPHDTARQSRRAKASVAAARLA